MVFVALMEFVEILATKMMIYMEKVILLAIVLVLVDIGEDLEVHVVQELHLIILGLVLGQLVHVVSELSPWEA